MSSFFFIPAMVNVSLFTLRPHSGRQAEGRQVLLILLLLFFFFFFVFLPFLGPHPWHIEVPRLGIESELQLLAYTRATAMRDPSCICHLCHSLWQHWILNPLSKARDWTYILTGTMSGFQPTKAQQELLIIYLNIFPQQKNIM